MEDRFLQISVTKKTFPAFAVVLLMFLLSSIDGDIYVTHWFVVGLCLSALLFFHLSKDYYMSFALLVTYLVASCFFNIWSSDIWVTKIRVLLDGSIARWTFFSFLTLVVMRDLKISTVMDAIKVVVIIGVVGTLLGYPLLDNPTTNAAMLACFAPLVPGLMVVGIALVVVMQVGITAWAILGFQCLVCAIWIWKWWSWWIVLGLILAGGVVLIRLDHHHFVDPVRFEYFRYIWDFFREYVDPIIGGGYFSFEVLSPVMQKMTGYYLERKVAWVSCHSDLLQWFFETGIVGCVLAFWVFIDIMRNAEIRVRLFLIGVTLFAIFYFPLRIPVILVITIYCTAYSLRLSDKHMSA